ncbi:MAG: class I SAM-dependent methyltransferase [Arenimonas sp.]
MTEPVLSSVEFYNSLSSIYDAELERRAPWVQKVEGLIAGWASRRGARSLIDFGCGNGRRALRLMQAANLTGAAIDVSPGMIDEAKRLGVDAHVIDIASPSFDADAFGGRRFDLAICTWNVLGHVEGSQARLQAVRNMRSVLAPGGAIVLDVNNRYNAAHYGWPAVLKNMLRDAMNPAVAGDFIANRQDPSGATMHTFVHVFSRGELHRLCGDAGLVPVEEHFLDYASGETRTRWSGQMCFLIEARA